MYARSTQKSAVAAKTRARILRSAEKIFARGGFRAMTLRDVTRDAKVNLAAVNYHFGSKTDLMRALVKERFKPINEKRLEMLESLVEEYGEEPIPLLRIFDALFRPLFAGAGPVPVKDEGLMCMIGRAMTEPADFMGQLQKEVFYELTQKFIFQIKRNCPHLSDEDLQYRFFLTIGTMIGAAIEQGRLAVISNGKLNGQNLDRILQELTAYVAAGFKQGHS